MKLAAIVAASFLAAAPVYSLPLVDLGSETFDPNTRLAWLDLTETSGYSVIGAQTAYTQYRIATQNEFDQMVVNAGLHPNIVPGDAAYHGAAQSLIALFGITFRWSDGHGFQGWTQIRPGEYIEPFVSAYDLSTTSPKGMVYPGGFRSNDARYSIRDVGVFMVRELAAVPLPGALGLLSISLGVLAATRLRFLRRISTLRGWLKGLRAIRNPLRDAYPTT